MKGRVTNTGYLDNSPDRFNDYNVIPSQHITMRGVSKPIAIFPIKNNKVSNPVQGMPGEDYYFPGAEGVVEMPLPPGNMSYQRMAKGGSSDAKMNQVLLNVAYGRGGSTMTPELAAKILKGGNPTIYGKTPSQAQYNMLVRLAAEIGIGEDGEPIEQYEDRSEDVEGYRRGGVPKAKKRHSRTTGKNIYTAINELFARNTMLYGNGGKEFYQPELKDGGWLDLESTASRSQNIPMEVLMNNYPWLLQNTHSREVDPGWGIPKAQMGFLLQPPMPNLAKFKPGYKDSTLENIAEFIDPTGILSWDDVYRSYQEHGLGWPTLLEAAGALPLVGKIGKSGKVLSGGLNALLNVVKGSKYLPPKAQKKVLDKAYSAYQKYASKGGKELDEALGYGTQRLVNAVPYVNPAMQKSIPQLVNAANYMTQLGKASKFLPENAYGGIPKAQNGLNTPEGWGREIRILEDNIGNPSQWDLDSHKLLQDKLNEYKAWRENTPEGRAVVDYHNEPNEYVVPLPEHLKTNPKFTGFPRYYLPKQMYGGDPSLPNIEGHYKTGGWLDQYQTRGEVKPYKAKSQEDYDYRKKMYNDSLALHNYSDFQAANELDQKSVLDHIVDIGFGFLPVHKGERDYSQKVFNYAKNLVKNNPRIKIGLPGVGPKLYTEEDYKKEGSTDVYHDTIKPASLWVGDAVNAFYKKPVQQILPYTEETIIKPSMTKDKSGRPVGIIGQTSQSKARHLMTGKDWQDINTYDYGAEEAKVRSADPEKFDIYRLPGNKFELVPKVKKTKQSVAYKKPEEAITPDYLSMREASLPVMPGKEPEINLPRIKSDSVRSRVGYRMDPETRKMVPVYLEGKQKVEQGRRIYNKNIPETGFALPEDFVPQFEPSKKEEEVVSKKMGGDPEMMYRDKYNTPLNAKEKVQFTKWVKEESKRQGRDISMDMGAYDVQGFWKSGAWKNRDSDGHGTDLYKKPNHPTFSDESMYAKDVESGVWEKDGSYWAPSTHKNLYSPDYYKWMFGLEPHRPEHFAGYSLPEITVTPNKKEGGWLDEYQEGGWNENVQRPGPVADNQIPVDAIPFTPKVSQDFIQQNVTPYSYAPTPIPIRSFEDFKGKRSTLGADYRDYLEYKNYVNKNDLEKAERAYKSRGDWEKSVLGSDYLKDPQQSSPNKLMQIDQAYFNKSKEKQYYIPSGKQIKLTQGRYNLGKIDTGFIDEVVKKAQQYGVDPLDILSIAGRESTFAQPYGKEFDRDSNDLTQLFSAWANEQKNASNYNDYFGKKNHPGLHLVKDKRGWHYLLNKGVNERDLYTQEDVDEYAKYRQENEKTASKDNALDFVSKMIKNNQLDKYNPGDPDYQNKLANEKKLLSKEKELIKYLDAKKQKPLAIKQYGGWLDPYDLPKAQAGLNNQKPINVTTPEEIQSMKSLGYPIYSNPQEFFNLYKDVKTNIPKGSRSSTVILDDEGHFNFPDTEKAGVNVPLFTKDPGKSSWEDLYRLGIPFTYCHGEQCTARANRAIGSLYFGSGKSFFQNPDVTKQDLGASFSTATAPTEQQQKMYDYMVGDTDSGSLDAWDIVPQAMKHNPKNVIFSAVIDKKKSKNPQGDFMNKAANPKDAWKKYDIPIGSFINLGYHERDDVVAGSHTVRVVGYKEDGEPLIADFGHIVPLSQNRIGYDQIAGIVSVPGKEKYTYKWFKNQAKEAAKPNTTPYISDINKEKNVTSGIIEDKWRNILGDKAAKYDENYKEFHDTLMSQKNKIKTQLGLEGDIYDKYAKIALTIGGVETDFGKGTLYRTLDAGESTGISQLNKNNVADKYKNILSNYEEGTPEYDAVATLLYVKSLDDYKKEWLNQGEKNKERPYTRTDYETVKGIVRSAQDHEQRGYLNSDWGGDKFVYEKGTIKLPFKTWGQDDQEYKDEVNKVLKAKDPNLRFDYDAKGNRVIYKKTQGNTRPVKENLEDFVFYAWQSPNSVVYGDAEGNSQYYKKAKKIYSELFDSKPQIAENLPKKKMGGSAGWLDVYQ